MAVSKAQQKAVHKYVKANYDRQEITFPKGKKDEIKAHAESVGESVNAFINRAVEEVMANEAKFADETTLEKRFRYRLKVHGMTLHRETDDYGKAVYYITDEVDTDRPEDNDPYRWLSFSEVESYCAEYYAEQRAERRAKRF